MATPAVLRVAGKFKDLACPACSNRGFETKKQFLGLSSAHPPAEFHEKSVVGEHKKWTAW